jgi:8-oxo-dGTP pyrophosphatase MutT (NUDIX family)
MISFDTGTHQFNLRAAAVILRDNAVLLHKLEGDTFWYLPGGRVDPGESAAATVVRELHEELSVVSECGPLLWLVENFFSYAGKQFHEIGMYFIVSPSPDSMLLTSDGPYQGTEGHRALTFAWFDRSRLDTVDLRPAFLARALAASELQFEHVVHRN